MEKCYNVTLTGKVQDIGFRAVVEYAGRLLNLSGLVFNARNGSVRIICRGEDNDIRDFAEEIKNRARGAIIQDITRQELPFDIELPYPFSRVLADEDIDIGRKLDRGIEILKDIKGDTSALPEIKEILTSFVVEQKEHNKRMDKHNLRMDEHNLRLEKILEKLAER